MSMNDDILNMVEEIDKKQPPADERAHRGYSVLVRPLAARIAKLDGGKCIRIKKVVAVPLVAALRSVLMREFGFRLISRILTGETYFWRGEKAAGLISQDEDSHA